MSGQGKRRRGVARAAIVTAALVTVGATAAAGFGLLRGGDDPAQARGELPPKTAQVTRQTLGDTQLADGELGHGDTTAVRCRLSGTLTSLTVVNSTVQRGQTLYKVDDAPVVLLYGSLPAYRDLAAGVKGPDVKQFEQNLYDLGYRGFTVDETYTQSTGAAVKDWQDDLGLTETGTVELGRVVYSGDAVRVDSHQATLGDALQPGTEVLDYTGTSRLITVELDPADQRLAKPAAAVLVTLPDGQAVNAKVTSTATVIQTTTAGNNGGDGGDGSTNVETKIKVGVAVDDQNAVTGLADASVSVAFTASTRENVLTVPVAALLALAEGGYGVQLVESDTTRIVAVQTGMFANGRVEVSGAGLTEGAAVGVPE